jgi:hypothetical protein
MSTNTAKLKRRVLLLLTLSILCSAALVGGEPRQDLSTIRGFNYTSSSAYNDIAFWRDYDRTQVERELDFAKRLQLNQARIFLNYAVYEREPEAFLDRVRHFARAAHARRIGVMFVVWDDCCADDMPKYDVRDKLWYPNPGPLGLGQDFWPAGERYVRDLVKTLADEPGLAFWDVMNEPGVRNRHYPDEFVRHFAQFLRELDPKTPTTVGAWRVEDMERYGDVVEVLSFHDYSQTRAGMASVISGAKEIAAKLHKPLLMTETGCLGRANPYDMAVEAYSKAGIGWYIWELMISQSHWGSIHGVVYPDGTVRDPAIVAALLGFFRNRGPEVIPAALDQEKAVSRIVEEARRWLEQSDAAWNEGLRIAEVEANLLEAGERVPMQDPPTRRLELLRRSQPNSAALREVLREWTRVLESDARP